MFIRMERATKLIAVFWFSILPPGLIGLQLPCREVASYAIDVRLNDINNLITGTEILTWTNPAEIPASDLWFHLYWNAFQDMQSTLVSESSTIKARMARYRPEEHGFCRVDKILVLKNETFDETDITTSLKFIQPDDDNPADRTVFRIRPPQPVRPGESICLQIKFMAKVPPPILLTGVKKEFFFVSQWFPKIGVFENGHWNCHQYHAHSEFYADFGTFDVLITLPQKYIVGATGQSLARKENADGTATHHFRQMCVHDFAWTASPRFIASRENFSYANEKSVEIILLIQPEHLGLQKRYMDAVKNALAFASRVCGDYPYSTLTCVDPAYRSGSGGQEYPALFTGGAYFLAARGIPNPEGIAIHEVMHQYFQGLVANDESENAWMDEGFASYLETYASYGAYGSPLLYKRYFGIPIAFKHIEVPFESVDNAFGISYLRKNGTRDLMQRFSWEYVDYPSYIANAYVKPEFMLHTLTGILGREACERVLKVYFDKWRFGHPRPKDFYDVCREVTGKDLSWLLDQFIFQGGYLDYAVESIQNIVEPNISIKSLDASIMSSHKGDRTKAPKPLYRTEVLVRRLGEMKIPVDIMVGFEDSKKIIEHWDGEYLWKKLVYWGGARARFAVVDPDHKLICDVNATNNSLTLKPERRGLIKWTTKWMLWIQHLYEAVTIFGG